MTMNRSQRFVEGVISTGLEAGLLRPEDIFEQVTPDVLARHLPVKLKAKLLGACLNSAQVTPNFLLDVVGLEALVLHAPMPLLWRCVLGCMERALGEKTDNSVVAVAPKRPKRPSRRPTSDRELVVLDDDAVDESLVVAEMVAELDSDGLDITHQGFGAGTTGQADMAGLQEQDEITMEIGEASAEAAEIVTAVGAAAMEDEQNR